MNPALTAMANSLRVGDHLLDRARLAPSSQSGPVPTAHSSGEQIEIAAAGQRAVVVEVGGGLRSYAMNGRELLDGYGSTRCVPPVADRC